MLEICNKVKPPNIDAIEHLHLAVCRCSLYAKEYAVYIILGYDLKANKEILGLWLNQTESKNRWMQIFDELKSRGVEDVFFISMDNVFGLEEGARSIFPSVIVQRCIGNAIRYIPSKDYKAICKDMKNFYDASSLKAANVAFEAFKKTMIFLSRCC